MLGFTLFVLLLEVLFVFKPMVRHIKYAASKIIESELHTRSIVDSAWDGIITANDQGIIETFNQAAEAMFGYAADEVRGARNTHIYDKYFYTLKNASGNEANRFGNIETIG